jgi:hypothetical protein
MKKIILTVTISLIMAMAIAGEDKITKRHIVPLVLEISESPRYFRKEPLKQHFFLQFTLKQ